MKKQHWRIWPKPSCGESHVTQDFLMATTTRENLVCQEIFSCLLGQYNTSCFRRISHGQGDFLLSHGIIEYRFSLVSWDNNIFHVSGEYLMDNEIFSCLLGQNITSCFRRISHGQGDFLLSCGIIEYRFSLVLWDNNISHVSG